jgi:hypothetical protein
MTIDFAKQTAERVAFEQNKAFMIFRFPAWPPECWGVIDMMRMLPEQAVVSEIVKPPSRQGSLF